LAALTQVEVRAVHHDWLDYLTAIAGLAGIVGAIVAMVALVIAKRAEKDAKVQREEAEAQRRFRERRAEPVVEVEASDVGMADPKRREIQLTIAFRNEGDKVAEHLHVNFLIPKGLQWQRVDGNGSRSSEGDIKQTDERLGAIDVARYWDVDVGRLVPNGAMNRLLYVRITNRTPACTS
jgi:hypothetical protein